MSEQLSPNGLPGVLAVPPVGPALGRESDALDLIGQLYGTGASTVVIPAERLDPEFFDLKTGLAGAFMNKFVLYSTRLVVVGDITRYTEKSGPLRDFVRESNQGKDVWFLGDLDELRSRVNGA